MVTNDVAPAIMNASTPEAAATLYRKMAAVMGKVGRVEKKGAFKSEKINYSFAQAADVADAVREALAEVGIAFFASMVDCQQELTKNGATLTKLTFEYTFACADSGATRTCLWRGESIGYGDKGINQASTAAEKYFLLKTFIISTGDEVDPDSKHENESKPTKSKRQQPASSSTTGQLSDTKATNGNGKAWYTSAVNVQAIQDATGMSLRDGLKLLGLNNPTEFGGDLDTFVAAVKAKQQPAPEPESVAVVNGQAVDTSTGEILDEPPAPKAFTFPSWFEPVRNIIVQWPHFQGKKNTQPSDRRIHASNAINEMLKAGDLTREMTQQAALDVLAAKYQAKEAAE